MKLSVTTESDLGIVIAGELALYIVNISDFCLKLGVHKSMKW